MPSYSTIKRGSRGDSVRTLQTALNNAGYSLDVDGIFGDNTYNAVRQYQRANGLSVDGIVGTNTWGALMGNSGSSSGSGSGSSSGSSGSSGSTSGSINSSTTITTRPSIDLPEFQQPDLSALQELLSQYTTDYDTLYQQAQNELSGQLESGRLNLQQQWETQQQNYKNQLNNLFSTLDRQQRTLNEQYNQSANSLNNALTARGLGRSSLVSTQGVALERARNTAINDLLNEYNTQANSIQESMTLAGNQVAAQIAQLENSYLKDLQARVDELRQQNLTAQTNLQLQISQMQMQGYQMYLDYILQQASLQEEQRQFNESMAFEREQASGSGGGGSSGGNYSGSSGSSGSGGGSSYGSAQSDAILSQLAGAQLAGTNAATGVSVGAWLSGLGQTLRGNGNNNTTQSGTGSGSVVFNNTAGMSGKPHVTYKQLQPQ